MASQKLQHLYIESDPDPRYILVDIEACPTQKAKFYPIRIIATFLQEL
jgi:hypothetical protein